MNLDRLPNGTPCNPAILEALINGQTEIVKYLAERGATVTSQLFNSAIYHGNCDLVRYFLDHGGISIQEVVNCSFSYAIEQDQFEIVRCFVEEYHVDLNPINVFQTPLTQVCSKGQMEWISFFLEHGANINGITRVGGGGLMPDFYLSPLIVAVQKNNLDLVKYLVDHGADVNLPSVGTGERNRTPLGVARERQFSSIISYLQSQQAHK